MLQLFLNEAICGKSKHFDGLINQKHLVHIWCSSTFKILLPQPFVVNRSTLNKSHSLIIILSLVSCFVQLSSFGAVQCFLRQSSAFGLGVSSLVVLWKVASH